MSKIKILIATRNGSKLALYKDVLGDRFEVCSPTDLNLPVIPVNETLDDARINAERKAEAYAGTSFDVAILGEDTSIEIPSMGNIPGPAVRRWCGELPDDVSDSDWVSFFREKMRIPAEGGLIQCLKKHNYHLILPDRHTESFEFSVPGEIRLRELPADTVYDGGPFSFFLYFTGIETYENDLERKDKAGLFSPVADFISRHMGEPETG